MMFLIAAATFVVCSLLVWFTLPSVPRANTMDDTLQDDTTVLIAPASA